MYNFNANGSNFNGLDLKITGGNINRDNHISFSIGAISANDRRGLIIEKSKVTL
ncbi:hypothetical protein [Faecalibacter sp. LW9]|uniref:hypothetical protein n=1 Tax=Faecalibacter sp. LW9 TaxID=3103144 RepID=UPI002AFFE350|nr:hypothetical protein [Faecalibacter sp. LW9]